jgi:tol-pal system protein YbgF
MRRLTILIAAVLAAAATPLSAANREHEQMMADIRMLQEQNQRLQLALSALNETLRALNTKLDDQGAATRKGFADQKLLIDGATGDLRVLREKLDETNVRLTSLSQDVDGLRDLVHQSTQAPPAMLGSTDATGQTPPPGSTPGPAPALPQAAAIGTTPRRLYETAYADYTAGQWSLAVQGFETYLKTFPKSDLADDAQYYIGEALTGDSKFKEAVAAYERVISDYPQSDILPEAYYKVGSTYERLGQPDKARAAYEYAVKNYGETQAGTLSKLRLDGRKRRGRGGADLAAVGAAITKGQGRDG